VLAGREFTDRDSGDAEPVAVVNRALARRYFPNEDPVGRQIEIDGTGRPMRIVGVVGDVHHASLATQPSPEIDVPLAQDPWPFVTIAIRSDAPASAVAGALGEAVASVDPDQPVANVATMEQLLSRSVAARRFSASLLGVFAAFAMLLAVVGVYAVVSYSVARRLHEIGIRMALGAGRRDIFRLVAGKGVALAASGVFVGVLAALALTRAISGMLFGVGPTDPAVFAWCVALLGGAAVAASVVPTYRATRVDPMSALRE
jgi:putative ABC transport system permease protein